MYVCFVTIIARSVFGGCSAPRNKRVKISKEPQCPHVCAQIFVHTIQKRWARAYVLQSVVSRSAVALLEYASAYYFEEAWVSFL